MLQVFENKQTNNCENNKKFTATATKAEALTRRIK